MRAVQGRQAAAYVDDVVVVGPRDTELEGAAQRALHGGVAAGGAAETERSPAFVEVECEAVGSMVERVADPAKEPNGAGPQYLLQDQKRPERQPLHRLTPQVDHVPDVIGEAPIAYGGSMMQAMGLGYWFSR